MCWTCNINKLKAQIAKRKFANKAQNSIVKCLTHLGIKDRV